MFPSRLINRYEWAKVYLTNRPHSKEETALNGIVMGCFTPSLGLWGRNSFLYGIRLILEIKFD